MKKLIRFIFALIVGVPVFILTQPISFLLGYAFDMDEAWNKNAIKGLIDCLTFKD